MGALTYRYAVRLAYEGSNYCGWQAQTNGVCVQEVVENALNRLEKGPHALYGAGRTDSGVHAWGQIAHFEMQREWEPKRLLLALDARLPEDISAMCVLRVPSDFHARFSAQSRDYLYVLHNSPVCYPHLRHYVHWQPGQFDWKLAAQASRNLLGEHDFLSFARQNPPPKNSIRKILKIRLHQKGDFLLLRICANGFLTYMVRIIMGTLTEIARGGRPPDWIEEQLAHPGSSIAGPKLPASGLHFLGVNYPSPLGGALKGSQERADRFAAKNRF